MEDKNNKKDALLANDNAALESNALRDNEIRYPISVKRKDKRGVWGENKLLVGRNGPTPKFFLFLSRREPPQPPQPFGVPFRFARPAAV